MASSGGRWARAWPRHVASCWHRRPGSGTRHTTCWGKPAPRESFSPRSPQMLASPRNLQVPGVSIAECIPFACLSDTASWVAGDEASHEADRSLGSGCERLSWWHSARCCVAWPCPHRRPPGPAPLLGNALLSPSSDGLGAWSAVGCGRASLLPPGLCPLGLRPLGLCPGLCQHCTVLSAWLCGECS